jgi:hypothetical protein
VLDSALRASDPATEMISEVYVPRNRLADFMHEVAEDFRSTGVDVVYGTIRLIERDEDSFLAWARQPYAGVIFNLHTVHTDEGIAHSAAAFRRLIDLAIAREGELFPHVPPLGSTRPGRDLLSADPRVLRPEAPVRPGRALPERLVRRLSRCLRLPLSSHSERGCAPACAP